MSREQSPRIGGESVGGEGLVRLRDVAGTGQSPKMTATLAAALANAAAEHQPSAAQLEGLRRALGSKLGTDGLRTPPPARSPRARLGWTSGIAVAVLALVGGALWFGHDVQTVAPDPMARPENPRMPLPAGAQAPTTEVAPARAQPEFRSTDRPGAPAIRTAPRQDEVGLVSRAQRALDSNPTLALALAERHREVFPDGALAQEREVIAVEALRALHRPDEARARARRFRVRYPDSAHLPRVERQRL